jgi:hypothetical protein
MTVDREALAGAQRRVEAARKLAEEITARATTERNARIREAVASGEATQAEAARWTGLTRGRIHQIINGYDS